MTVTVKVAHGDRQMVQILTCVRDDGLQAVEAACREALDQGVHSAPVIINIHARSKDAAPPPLLLTPASLRLTPFKGYATPELAQMAPERIDRLRPLPDQQFADLENHRGPWICSLFTGTKRIVGRMAASQIASESAASFFWRLTSGFT